MTPEAIPNAHKGTAYHSHTGQANVWCVKIFFPFFLFVYIFMHVCVLGTFVQGCGAQKSISSVTLQALSPLLLRQGLLVAHSSLRRLSSLLVGSENLIQGFMLMRSSLYSLGPLCFIRILCMTTYATIL